MTLLNLLIAIRATLELVLWLIMGRSALAILAGRHAAGNSVLRMFDFLLRPVRVVSNWLMPHCSYLKREWLSFFLVLLLWFGLGIGKLLVVVDQ